MPTRAVGLAGVQLVARAADAFVPIWEVHTSSRAADVGGSSGASVNACDRARQRSWWSEDRGRHGESGEGGRAQGPQRTHRSLTPLSAGPSHIHM